MRQPSVTETTSGIAKCSSQQELQHWNASIVGRRRAAKRLRTGWVVSALFSQHCQTAPGKVPRGRLPGCAKTAASTSVRHRQVLEGCLEADRRVREDPRATSARTYRRLIQFTLGANVCTVKLAVWINGFSGGGIVHQALVLRRHDDLEA